MAFIDKIDNDNYRCMLIDGTVLTLSKEGLEALLESLKN